MAFKYYEKAFDSVETTAVMKSLKRQGVGEIYLKILKDIYKESTATIMLYKIRNKIPLQKGVR